MSQSQIKRKALAYCKTLVERRRAGERIGLLVVSVHDWESGRMLEQRPNVARVVVPEDVLPHQVDWSPCVALDCLVIGNCNEPVFYAAVIMLSQSGAASIWGEFSDGVHRLERTQSKLFPGGIVAVEGPVEPVVFPHALHSYREWALMSSRGVYGTRSYDAARSALFDQVFGAKSSQAQAFVARMNAPLERRAQ